MMISKDQSAWRFFSVFEKSVPCLTHVDEGLHHVGPPFRQQRCRIWRDFNRFQTFEAAPHVTAISGFVGRKGEVPIPTRENMISVEQSLAQSLGILRTGKAMVWGCLRQFLHDLFQETWLSYMFSRCFVPPPILESKPFETQLST